MGLLVRNGRIVLAEGEFVGDVYVENDRVLGLGQGFEARPGDEVLDADARWVLPGGVDPFAGHGPGGSGWYLDAAAGGTTTAVAAIAPEPGEGLIEALGREIEDAYRESRIDFAFHLAVPAWTDRTGREMAEAVARGAASFLAPEGDPHACARVVEAARSLGARVWTTASFVRSPGGDWWLEGGAGRAAAAGPPGRPIVRGRVRDRFARLASGAAHPSEAVGAGAANAARALGWAGRKGTLVPGADADLTVWDPADLAAGPRDVLLRGRPVIRDGRPADGPDRGVHLPIEPAR